jgi:hypothetical protein
MISDKKRLEISNVCYTNVAGDFAMFANPKFRGENFTWDEFPKRCEELAVHWMDIYNVRGDKQMINDTAKQYAREIAARLVQRMCE